MRLPVATNDPNPEGFTWTHDGELVMIGFTCDRDLRDPDMGCGCGRSFAGLDSHKGTTRAVVEDRELDLIQVRDAVRVCLEQGGWIGKDMDEADIDLVAECAAQMVEIGETFPPGTRLGRRLDDVYAVVV